ncbi:ABC transporter permease [Christensenellaceae bacterium OttesenSCG-928-M15]|nr:ABC transporter permease [Christensenellaceae bacterium OttesenSCG-928-M15]
MLKKIKKNKMIFFGGLIVAFVVLLAVCAPLLTSYDYETVMLDSRNLAPSAEHPMGTDSFGRDVWARVLYGARISLTVSLSSVAVGLVIGAFLGLLSGFFKGWVDFLLGRIMDIVMSFPAILLSLLIGIAFGTSMVNMSFTIGIPFIPIFYRVTRGAALSVTERTYVNAATTMGSSSFYTMFRHILPNTLPQLFVIISSSMGGAITAEAALGYLGLGIPRPTPSWGIIINDGRQLIFDAPWITGFGGLMIALTIFGFNLLGDGLRDYMDPKLKHR